MEGTSETDRKTENTNETDRKNEANACKEKDRLAAKPIIFWVMCIICVIIGVAAIFANIYIIANMPPKPVNAKQAFEAVILSDCVAIIGLAIAVWAGLNIANAVERKELEELSEKNKRLTEETETLHKQIEPLSKNAESIDNTLNNLFLEELLKTDQDEASQWFLRRFAEIANDKRAELLKEDVSKLLMIENKFSLVYGLHTSKQCNNLFLFDEAQNGISEIDKIIGEMDEIKNRTGLNLVDTYLKFRRAEFEFYKGYATENAKKVYDCFRKAAEVYMDMHEEFGVFLPAYMGSIDSKSIPKYGSEESFRKISIYFANSIGEAYSRIISQGNNLKNDYDFSGEQLSGEALKKIAEKGVFYCACAAKWADEGNVSKEVYFRNLGCAYERLEKLESATGKYADEILENYKKAFTNIVDQDVVSYRIQSVYYTLMQYLKKYLELKLHIGEIFKDSSSFQKAIQDKAVLKELPAEEAVEKEEELDEKQKEELERKRKLWDNLKYYCHIIEFAKRDNCRHHLQYEMEGFIMSILIVLKLSEYKKTNEICELDVEECKKVIEGNITILNCMNIKDGYYDQLISRKQIIFGEKKEEAEEKE